MPATLPRLSRAQCYRCRY